MCTSSLVLVVVQSLLGKPTEHEWSDKNSLLKIHLEQCDEVQWLLDITNLGLFSDGDNNRSTVNWNSRIILVVDNIKVIDNYKNFYVLLFNDIIKINAMKPASNTGI